MITLLLCSIGTYCLLQPMWEWLEVLELGVANTTIIDTVICMAISGVIAFVVVDNNL